jgi:hypothetical protein
VRIDRGVQAGVAALAVAVVLFGCMPDLLLKKFQHAEGQIAVAEKPIK